MARGLIIGSTDYSSQSLQDMLVDLEEWIEAIRDSEEVFKSVINELQKVGYWNSVDYDFRASSLDLLRYFNTAITDLDEVIKGIYSEIKEFHIKLLKNLGSTAQEKYKHHRSVWRNYQNKNYGEDNFTKVEKLYVIGSDMTGDMFDLSNLAARLEQFVGMSKIDTSKAETQVYNTFNAPITGIQQNYNSSEIQQTVDVSSTINQGLEDSSLKKFSTRNQIITGAVVSFIIGFILLFSFWETPVNWIEGLFD